MSTQSRTLADTILASDGKFVTVQFVKKDGSLRTLTGRLGVKKYVLGTGAPVKPEKYITIYDVQCKGYRCINKDTIVALRANGIESVAV